MTISTVTGPIQTGQLATISGFGFIQEDRSAWDPLFISHPTASSFEGQSLSSDGYGTSGCPTYTTAMKLMGTQSVNMHDMGQHIRMPNGSGLGSCNWQWDVQASHASSSWTDVYLRTYSRWHNTSWPTIDTKYWWIAGGANYAFFNLINYADGRAPTEFGVYTSGVGSWVNGPIPGGPIVNDRWYLFEAHFRLQGSGGYVIEAWIDNQAVFSRTVPDGPSPNPSNWGWESNTNYFDTPAGWVSDHWQDGFAVSRNRIGPASLIELANGSTYATATKVYQEPVFLSDTSVQFKVNLTGLGAGPSFLFVTNNRGQRSAAFPLP